MLRHPCPLSGTKPAALIYSMSPSAGPQMATAHPRSLRPAWVGQFCLLAQTPFRCPCPLAQSRRWQRSSSPSNADQEAPSPSESRGPVTESGGSTLGQAAGSFGPTSAHGDRAEARPVRSKPADFQGERRSCCNRPGRDEAAWPVGGRWPPSLRQLASPFQPRNHLPLLSRFLVTREHLLSYCRLQTALT